MLPEPVEVAARSLLTFTHPIAPSTAFVRALLAVWLVATMVWLIHRTSRASTLPVIWACTALMPLLHLEHIVVGSVEAAYGVAAGLAGISTVVIHLTLAFVGNTLGGVLRVALLNHARTSAAASVQPRLPWRHWLLGLPQPLAHPDVLHGIQGRSHRWLNAPGRAPVPSDLYETPHQLARAARDFGASKLVLHRRDGPVRVIELDSGVAEVPLTGQ